VKYFFLNKFIKRIISELFIDGFILRLIFYIEESAFVHVL